MKKYLLILLFIISLSSTSFGYTNEEYIKRANKLQILTINTNMDKNITRAESIIMLSKVINFEQFPKQNEYSSFKDVYAKDPFYPAIKKLSECGIINLNDYSNGYLIPQRSISNYEFSRMLERIYKYEKNINKVGLNNSLFLYKTTLNTSFKKLKQKDAAISIIKLLDDVYYNEPYGIDLLSPINGNYYSDNLDIELNSEVSKHIKTLKVYINNNCVKTIENFQNKINFDISKYSAGSYELYVSGVTQDDIILKSIPVQIILNKVSSNQSALPLDQASADVLKKSISPSDFKALTNNVKKVSSISNRLLFVCDSPEEFKDATGSLLFDSGIQSENFRLLMYHANNISVQSAVYLKIEIENLGIENLDVSSHEGYNAGVYGNIVGYYSTLNYFNSYDSANIKNYKIGSYSKATLFSRIVKPNDIASYLGDFDFNQKGFYRLKVYFYPVDSQPNDNLAATDNKHTRGIFSSSDYLVNVDKTNVCFQIGTNKKKYSSEANVINKSYGINQSNMVANDGHFGEIYNINISNQESKSLAVVVEFRGTVQSYSSYMVFRDGFGKTKNFGVNSDSALYLGKQLIIDRTNIPNYNFSITIPSGMNGPLYVYVIEI